MGGIGSGSKLTQQLHLQRRGERKIKPQKETRPDKNERSIDNKVNHRKNQDNTYVLTYKREDYGG